MSQCDRFDGMDSTDEQDSISSLLDNPNVCDQVRQKRALTELIQRLREVSPPMCASCWLLPLPTHSWSTSW